MTQQQGVLIEKNVTTGGVFSDSAVFTGYFNLSLSGAWGATVHLQRKFKDGSSWFDVDSFTVNTEKSDFYEPEGEVAYRIGIKNAANYTSGTPVARISQ